MTELARDLAVLVELFQSGGWREIRVESATVSVLLSTDPETGVGITDGTPVPAVAAPSPPAVISPAARAPAVARAATVEPSWRAVSAPNLGTFYRSPKPGAAPFVEVGDTVTPDTEICLLEVMKLFTSVKAGVGGVVRRIAARDAELVEGGQILFYIEPQES